MTRSCQAIMKSAVSALICAVQLAACSIMVLPNDVRPITGFEAVSLAEVSCIVTNAEEDSSEHVILNDKGEKTGIRANRQAWSKKLVEALAVELAKRGAHVRINAPLTLNVALPEITFTQIGNLNQFIVKVVVASSTGWSGKYEGIAESGLSAFESMNVMANRLAGQALAEAIKAMLRDEDFVAQLRKS